MKKLLLLSGLLISIISSSAQTTVPGSFVHGGITRTYSVYIPASYNGSQAFPLVLNLHGYTSNAAQQELYGDFRPIADTANFIIVHPNGSIQPGSGTTQFWNVGFFASSVDDVDFLETLIDTISAHYNINQRRIYSAGMSNGGFMGYTLACESDRFAAIGSVTGSMTLTTMTNCNPARPIPTIEVHGTADQTVPYAGSALMQGVEDVVNFWVTENNCSPTPSITPVPNTNLADSATAERYLYSGGTDGHTVEFFKVTGGAHTWPGAIFAIDVTCMDFSASKELWRFFSQYEHPTAGIKENSQIDFQVWPNPASEQIFVQVPNKNVTHLSVIDMQGRMVYSIDGGHVTVADIAGIRAGNYILQISGDDFVAQKKIVIR